MSAALMLLIYYFGLRNIINITTSIKIELFALIGLVIILAVQIVVVYKSFAIMSNRPSVYGHLVYVGVNVY